MSAHIPTHFRLGEAAVLLGQAPHDQGEHAEDGGEDGPRDDHVAEPRAEHIAREPPREAVADPEACAGRALEEDRERPEQREQAWSTGFKSGDPSTCNSYLTS